MHEQGIEESLARVLPASRVRRKAPLAPFTTFGLGGPADWLVEVATEAELCDVLAVAAEAGLDATLLGGGSNVLVADDGVRGIVIRPRFRGVRRPAPDRVRAGSSITMNGLVRWTVGRGLSGLEAWAGTPGTVGGAIFGNAHWAGRNIGDLVWSVRLVSRDGRSVTEATREELEFGYDASRLQRTGEVLIAADFTVGTGAPDDLRRVARASLAFRKRTQPLAMPSAGCVFQNPDPARESVPAGVPPSAGALVDRAGLKGYRIGGASISERHANFIVNDGTATARDVRALVEVARAAVRERFGIDLRDEVVYLGTFRHG